MEHIITRKKIKNFIIRIYPDKSIKISVPYRATNEQIERFLNSKKEWIDKCLEKFDRKIEKDLLNLEYIKYLGKNYKKVIIESSEDRISVKEKKIFIYTKEKNKDYIDKILLEWKLKNLKNILNKYLEKYSSLLGKSINFYKIKTLKSAWGINHSRNNYVVFNFLLIEKDVQAIEYVVLHELCHIFHRNHQREFWSLLEKFMPNYTEKEKILKS